MSKNEYYRTGSYRVFGHPGWHNTNRFPALQRVQKACKWIFHKQLRVIPCNLQSIYIYFAIVYR